MTAFLIGLTAMVALAGCRSVPKPIIVGDTYTNIHYEYSLRLPPGWEPLDTIPPGFGYFETLAPRTEMRSLLLYNAETGGVIAIMNAVNRFAFKAYFDVSYEKWEQTLLDFKSSTEGKLPVVAYNHSIHMENLNTTQLNYFLSQFAYKPEKLFQVESSVEVDDQRAHYRFDTFVYPCRNSRSCEMTIFLTCFEENLAPNRAALEVLLSSLQAHDYYD
jgi:hypothetical protein